MGTILFQKKDKFKQNNKNDKTMETKLTGPFMFDGQGLTKINAKPNLPMYCKVYIYGYGMSMNYGAIISDPDQYGRQKVVHISDFKPVFSYADKYSRPHSKKFGIGLYYSDTFELVDQSEVQKYILKAEQAEIKAEQDKRAKEQADKEETERLPKEYPMLIISKSQTDTNKNIRALLSTNFPGVKFSVVKEHYDCTNISWIDGPTQTEVSKITNNFCDGQRSHCGDYTDTVRTNFTRLFGGIKYIFCRREQSEQVKNVLQNNSRAYQIFCETSIPLGAKITGMNGNEIEFIIEQKHTEQSHLKKEVEQGKVQIVKYSDRAVVVVGDTYPIKDKLRQLGGKFNKFLSCGAGWIFPSDKFEELKTIF